MTAKTARLRPVPTIAYEPEEGLRLRRASGEAGLKQQQVQAADRGRPIREWNQDVYSLQMKAKVAFTLIEDMFSHLKALEDLYQFSIRDHVGLDELAFQVHEIKTAAEALQPA